MRAWLIRTLALLASPVTTSLLRFTALHGVGRASFQQKNDKMVYQILLNGFTRPEPVYTA